MIIDLYVGYKKAYCYGVEKGENSVIIAIESEVWYFIRNQQIDILRWLTMNEENMQNISTILLDMYGVIIEESKGNFIPYTYEHFNEI